MRWKGRRQSTNVEDRRRATPGRKMAMGGGIGAILIAVIAAFMGGGDLSSVLRAVLGNATSNRAQGGTQTSDRPLTAQDKRLTNMVKTVLADTEDIWTDLFPPHFKRKYEKPVLVLFHDRVQWAGGIADKAMGPFYSPSDKKIFIDLSFYNEMDRKLNAPGDFAQAYVLAHEVGHHMQNLLGISGRVHQARSRVGKTEYNRLSVRLELQADFFAGVWAHHAEKRYEFLEPGDIEEALNAAAAIGDDTLQKKSRGYAVPDSFTHGTSAQRVAWFRHGFRTGDPTAGNTFDEAVFRRIDPGG